MLLLRWFFLTNVTGTILVIFGLVLFFRDGRDQVGVPFLELRHQVFETGLQIGIDKDAIKVPRRIPVIQFGLRIRQARLYRFFGFRIAMPQALFQVVPGRWGDEDVSGWWLQLTGLDLLDTLHINVQDTDLATLLDRFNRFNTERNEYFCECVSDDSNHIPHRHEAACVVGNNTNNNNGRTLFRSTCRALRHIQ